MNIEIAKKKIDNQLIRGIYADSPLDNFHPMRIIQALKSLIGINIDSPSNKLISWGEVYLSSQNKLFKNYFNYSIKVDTESKLREILKLILRNFSQH